LKKKTFKRREGEGRTKGVFGEIDPNRHHLVHHQRWGSGGTTGKKKKKKKGKEKKASCKSPMCKNKRGGAVGQGSFRAEAENRDKLAYRCGCEKGGGRSKKKSYDR